METSLRRMGNSVGMIVPKAVLAEIGATLGGRLSLSVEDGRLVAEPLSRPARAGWADAARQIAGDAADDDWSGFGNEGDADLTW